MPNPTSFNLNDISDVRAGSVSNGETLVFQGGVWIPKVAGATPVSVSGDWTTAATAKSDIETATGITFPADTALKDIFVTLWEGSADQDDFAVLRCSDTPEWTAQNGAAAAFASAPVSGAAYIMGMSINGVIG